MSANYSKSIRFDTRPDEYRPFMVDNFAKRAAEIANQRPVIRQQIYDLLASWRGTSYTAAMPKLIPDAIADSIEGHRRGGQNDHDSPERIDAQLTLLARRVPEISTDPQLRDKLTTAIWATASELREAVTSLPPLVTRQDAWDHYTTLAPFLMGLDQTMRNSYVSVFAAYEAFVTATTSIALNGERCRVTPQNAFHDQL